MQHRHADPDSDRRRASRLEAPEIALRLAARTYRTANWSLGGALIDDCDGRLAAGALFDITEVGGPDEERARRVHIRARVSRTEDDGRRIAVQFLEIDRAAYDFFRHLDTGHEATEPSRRPVARPIAPPPDPRRRHPVLGDMSGWPARRAPGLERD